MKYFFEPSETEKIRETIADSKHQIIVIAGPTASGKSAIAIEMAKKFQGAIVNADSRQIYKEIPIGSAMPKPDKILSSETVSDIFQIENIDHYLYAFKSVFDTYTLVDYQKDLQDCIRNISKKYRKIFIVGGTGLYIDAYVFNYNLNSENNSGKNRTSFSSLSVEELQALIPQDKLLLLNESDRKNQHRLIRHIERDGRKYSKGKPRDHTYIVITPTLKKISENIEIRTEQMFKNGLEDENKKLRSLEKEMLNKDNSLSRIHKTIGYSEFDAYFENMISIEEVKQLISLHTRQYAKRQRTWFNRMQ